MENEVKRAVGATVGLEHGPEGGAETRKEWEAPNLRKIDIAEITANGSNITPDGVLSS